MRDDLDAARGIFNGVCIGLMMWLVIWEVALWIR
ncbi:hypothetical protein J2736_006720 [Paenibacillus qinlingensis]|uniref:Uncharacterized protein n=1 Tax=Paenibacillus qinlingensis TaxID=1837343 RepID=A0ABU1P6Z3_9BACL|nr:hypothetical protein [Paenibacillus qinlingensis]